jgi:CRISPR-associated protein Csx3
MLNWKVTNGQQWTLIEFELEGSLDPRSLVDVGLPASAHKRMNLGLIISGRGPVWLYGRLVHLAHPFAWVATYEPRLRAGIVVESHVPHGPQVGQLVPIEAETDPLPGENIHE